MSFIKRPLLLTVLVITIGGFLFGYSTAVIAGAMLFIKEQFSLDPVSQGLAVSVVLLGALGASSLGGILVDRYGRKISLLFSANFFIIGALISAGAANPDMFMLGRFITGLGVGLVSVTAPTYLSEIAPTSLRGGFVTFYQLAITLGILIAYLMNFVFVEEKGWRWMVGLAAVPAVLQLLLSPALCESPRWFLGKGCDEKAHQVMQRLGLKGELADAHRVIASASWSILHRRGMRLVLFIGLAISFFQQVTGINAVIYYAPQIFEFVGLSSAESAVLATIGVGSINVLATILAVWLLDRAGRKILLLIGLSGMTLSLGCIALAFVFYSSSAALISMIGLMAYVAFFAMSLGPITWVLISEIYPLAIRGKAVALAVLVNWLFNYLVALTFLDIVDRIGAGAVFGLFAALSIIAFLFVWRFVPETKGKSLAQIEAMIRRG